MNSQNSILYGYTIPFMVFGFDSWFSPFCFVATCICTVRRLCSRNDRTATSYVFCQTVVSASKMINAGSKIRRHRTVLNRYLYCQVTLQYTSMYLYVCINRMTCTPLLCAWVAVWLSHRTISQRSKLSSVSIFMSHLPDQTPNVDDEKWQLVTDYHVVKR